MDARRKYKWMNPIAFVWVALLRDHLLPAVHARRRAVEQRLQLVVGQLRPARHDRGDRGGDDLVLAVGAQDVQGPGPHDRRTRRTAARDVAHRPRRAWRRGPPSLGRLRVDGHAAVIEPATEAVLAEVPRAASAEVDAAVARAKARAARRGARSRRRSGRARCTRWPTRSRPTTRSWRCSRRATPASRSATRAARSAMVVDTFRYYAGAPERLLGDTIPVAGGAGVHRARAARRRRADHAVELPAHDRLLEARAGARGRQHGRAQAGRADAADRAALRASSRARPGCPTAWSTSSSGPGATCGQRLVEHPDVAKIAFTGLDRGRPLDRGRRGGDDQARHARARRQVGQRRVRRRRPRGGRGRRAARRCSATPARTAARARASSSRRRCSTASWRCSRRREGDPRRRPARRGHRRWAR